MYKKKKKTDNVLLIRFLHFFVNRIHIEGIVREKNKIPPPPQWPERQRSIVVCSSRIPVRRNLINLLYFVCRYYISCSSGQREEETAPRLMSHH